MSKRHSLCLHKAYTLVGEKHTFKQGMTMWCDTQYREKQYNIDKGAQEEHLMHLVVSGTTSWKK